MKEKAMIARVKSMERRMNRTLELSKQVRAVREHRQDVALHKLQTSVEWSCATTDHLDSIMERRIKHVESGLGPIKLQNIAWAGPISINWIALYKVTNHQLQFIPWNQFLLQYLTVVQFLLQYLTVVQFLQFCFLQCNIKLINFHHSSCKILCNVICRTLSLSHMCSPLDQITIPKALIHF
jgi:hypothetical protein